MRKILYKILFAANILLVLALLISYISVNISPEDFVLPAFFGLAYPYLLLLNIMLVIIWAVNLKIEALISLSVIILGFTHLNNYMSFGKPGRDTEGAVKLLSYNVRLFNYYENSSGKGSESQIFELIKKEAPDIICLQDYFISGTPSIKDNEVKKALGGKYYSHVKLIGISRGKYYGIATYTKYPIINKGDIVHPKSSSLSIFTDVIIKKDTFRIYNNHLQSYGLKRVESSFFEDLYGSESQTVDEILSVSSTLRTGFIKRAAQSKKVKEDIDKSPYPVIVVGDFNDTPVSYSYRIIKKGMNDAFVKGGQGAGFTYRGNYPPNRIDFILFDKNSIECSAFDIIKVKYSDHYPIIGYLRKSVKKEDS